ncbi:serine hydrolase domain-containing protein [Nocardioides caldifontis]|uniref:serine hydrolase domain-containing protein n=1 Tax=Nocardioides caldifontis TaxID=2588938 RepID=UPI0011DF6F81|nr:serine hydrolase domain-containing protein [Nocardioides caldifontis]
MSGTPGGGTVAPRFAPVEAAFREVVEGHPGTGASLAVRHDGEWVVDLWGGWADAARTRPWQRDTLVMPYSVTKPFAAVCVLLLVDRGLVALDEPVATYWPELRAATTVRELLAHRSGLVLLDEPLPEEALYDWDRLCASLAAQEPAWEPGTAAGESALFYGHLLGEVVRRVDGRPLGRFLAEEVCGPLDLDFHVGLADAELARVAELTGFGDELRSVGEGRPPLYARAVGNPPGLLDPAVVNSERWRRAEIPAVNGHGTARAVAGFHVALGRGTLLSDAVRRELVTGVEDEDLVIGGPTTWGLGVALDPDGFGMGGLGGSFGWWSEVGGYAIAFLTGHVGDHDRGDRLEGALREVLGLPPL